MFDNVRDDLDRRITSAMDAVDVSVVRSYCERSAQRVSVLTILMGDQVGSTQAQSVTTNLEGIGQRDAFRVIYQDVLSGHDGQHVEYAGDAFLAVFALPSDAVKCALRLQQAYNATENLRLRLGLHDGEIIFREGAHFREIYGREVSLCARVCDLGGASQILVTRSVFDKARSNISPREGDGQYGELQWENWGGYHFKGIERDGKPEAYEVCEVAIKGTHELKAPKGSAKSYPADGSGEVPGWRPAVGIQVPGTSWVLVERLGSESDTPEPDAESEKGQRNPAGMVSKDLKATRNSAEQTRYRGEFGEVWKAYNTAYKSHQVFKFCFKREQIPVLKREARLLKTLRAYHHPNLVEVYDVTEGDTPPHYLEMEYVEGPSLEEWLEGNPRLEERLEVISQVADALHVVHSAGILHRDIKPSNILLTHDREGRPLAKLSDFGLGAASDPKLLESIKLSRVEGMAGTWDYIAPEVKSEKSPPSPRSDVYSLGLTLFQVVVGDLRQQRPTSFSKFIDDEVLREDMENILSDAPEQRPTASEFSSLLKTYSARRAQRIAEQEQARQRLKARRQRVIAGITLLIALISTVGGGVALWQRNLAQKSFANEKEARIQAEEAKQDARSQLYTFLMLQLRNDLQAGRFLQAKQKLWQAPVEYRNWEWGFAAKLITSMLIGHKGNVNSVQFSPDDSLIITSSNDRTATIWETATCEPLHILDQRSYSPIIQAQFSPDGMLVATASLDNSLTLWNVKAGTRKDILDIGELGNVPWVRSVEDEDTILHDEGSNFCFSPDGQFIATSNLLGEIWIRSTETGIRIVKTEQAIEGLIDGLAFLQNDKIAAYSFDNVIHLFDAKTGKKIAQWDLPELSLVRSPKFSPGGKYFCSTEGIWNVETGELSYAPPQCV